MIRNIVLIGHMGTGKSTVGRALAEKLGWQFVDTDERIERAENTSIKDIFAAKGEAYFRQAESRILKQIFLATNQVIATGGGAVLALENREAMKREGYVVSLTATAETMIERLRNDQNRPLLQGGIEERVHFIREQRKHAYDFADWSIDCTRLPLVTIVNSIAERIIELNK